MTRALRNAVLTLTALLLLTGVLFGQAQGRVQGTVVDENGDPIQGVKVTITAENFAFEEVKTTDKKGRFAILFVDATRVYDFVFEKEGYVNVKQPLKPIIGDNMRQEFVVPTVGAEGAKQGTGTDSGPSTNPAINTFNDGVTAFQEGDLETAKAKFLKAAEQDRKLVEPYSALAGIYIDEGNNDQALAMASKVLELEPGNSRALRVQYDVYREQGNDAEADAVLEQLKEADGGTDTAVRIFNEGAEAARLGDLDAARARFEEAVELDPELAAGHNALARVYFLQEEFEKSIAAADLAMEIDPGMTADVLKFKYESYRGLGQDQAALEVFQQMSAEDPEGTARALFDQGEAMYDGGNIAGAAAAFEQVLAADPTYLRAHYYLGLCYVNSGESAKAKEHLQKFIDEVPDDPEVGTAKEMLSYLG
ncbi:MAG: tetratricopeptide repeat protein [Acidobacteriota bacterium]